jgi:2-methylcitrate dehydratase
MSELEVAVTNEFSADCATDTTIARIVDYALATDFANLPGPVVHECKRRLIDTFGCAIAGFDDEPSRIARIVALKGEAAGGATILGTGRHVLPELACFANGVAMRCMDGNDCFPGGGGHPSGVIAPVLAAAQMAGADARAVIAAIVIGYDAHYRLWQACRVLRKGFDHSFYSAVAAAVAVAKVLRLDRAAFANALAIAITPNLPFAVTRRGALSMWKGCAEAHAAKNGLFAAELARAGMSGPALAIEGAMAVRALFGPFELAAFPNEGGDYAILRTDMKFYVTEYHSQGPIFAALKLRSEIDLAAVTAITIHTYEFAYREIGSGAEKWRPLTRETADHSMPYIVAAALADGAFSDAVFAPARFADPKILALADTISVREDADINRDYPRKFRCRVDITTADGATRSASVDYPHGHHLDPVSDAEVEAKFRELAGRKLPREKVEALLATLWGFDKAANADAVFALADIEAGRD